MWKVALKRGPQAVDVALLRLFFVLAEPLSIPSGYQRWATVGDDPTSPQEDDPEVSIIFHQVDANVGKTSAAFDALHQVLRQAVGLPDIPEVAPFEFASEFTVVEAVTSRDSPDPVPEADADHPARWSPRADPFARCLRLADLVVRALRHATEWPYGSIAYVRIASPVLVYHADGVRESVVLDGVEHRHTRPVRPWQGPDVMLLDHANLADPCRGLPYTPDVEMRLDFWLGEGRRGNPMLLWRERIIEARRANEVSGESAQAVLLANTSAEVMLDVILALLLWEEDARPCELTAIFEEGKVARRLTAEFPKRLKGNWSTGTGAVGDWYRSAYKVRHRVIHSGYTPTQAEADAAIQATFALQRFVMDRIAAQRTAYPRSALITLGEEGLRARHMWSGQVKRFAEANARNMHDWRDAFTAFYRKLIAALAPHA